MRLYSIALLAATFAFSFFACKKDETDNSGTTLSPDSLTLQIDVPPCNSTTSAPWPI